VQEPGKSGCLEKAATSSSVRVQGPASQRNLLLTFVDFE
jgi:hypothetical protein